MTIILMKYKIRWVINKYLEIIVGLEMYVNNINLQCMAQQANSPPELYVWIYSLGATQSEHVVVVGTHSPAAWRRENKTNGPPAVGSAGCGQKIYTVVHKNVAVNYLQ